MDWIKFVTEIIFSICSVVISLVVFLYSKKSNKTNLESGIYQLIQDAKINLDNQTRSILNELKEIKEGKDKEKYISNTIPAPIETYLNALDSACALCCTKAINKKRFLSLFSDDIMTVFDSDVYKNSLNAKDSNFIYLKKLHLEIVEKRKL